MNNGWMSSSRYNTDSLDLCTIYVYICICIHFGIFFDFRIADAIRDLSCGRKI